MPRSLNVGDKDMELDVVVRPQTGCSREVDTGVADRGRDFRESSGLVRDLDDEVVRDARTLSDRDAFDELPWQGGDPSPYPFRLLLRFCGVQAT